MVMNLVASWQVFSGDHDASFVFKQYTNKWCLKKPEMALYWASNNLSTKQYMISTEAFKMACWVVTNIACSYRSKIQSRRFSIMGLCWLAIPLKILFLIFLCAATSVETFADLLTSSKCKMLSSMAAPQKEKLWSLLSQQHSSSTWSFWRTA